MTVLKLDNAIMDYAWGSRDHIAELQGRPTPAPGPEAELWMGAHPKAPSRVDGRSLADVIADDPAAALGPAGAAARDGRLPFLFKLLAAAEPLSLQAHPDRERARRGFALENEAGVPLDAPHRNYRDDNHKPEMVCALTEFWALNGFRETDEMLALLDAAGLDDLRPEIEALRAGDGPAALQTFFTSLMTLPADRLARLDADLRAAAAGPLASRPEGPWLERVLARYPNDPGCLAVLLLNLVRLEPGQAMFSAAGELHSYLGGFCVELMADSDNVLRGGLTPKHVDLEELSATLSFAPWAPEIVAAEAGAYPSPDPEFALARVEAPWTSDAEHGFAILVAVSGSGEVGGVPIRGGEAVAVTADHGAYAVSGDLALFKAETP